MRILCALLLLAAPCLAQDYWTPRQKIETAMVTSLHIADAAQTCYHLAHGSHENSPLTPGNCAGATVAIIGEGAAAQYLSYRLARRFAWWRRLDRALPYVQMSLSVNAIRCSYSRGGCNSFGF